MTYLDVLLLIEKNGDHVLTQEGSRLITEQHLYTREDGQWTENTEPGAPEAHYGRSGTFYGWKTTTAE